MSHHRYHSSAPFSIKALAAVVAVDGLVAVSDAVGMLGASLVLALVFVVVGLAHLALSYGLWQLEPYAYSLGLVVFGVGLLLDVVHGNLVGALLSTTTISMLYRHRGLYRD